jgi:photosystem II stability/assembly factor-like uncharacterized protein
MKHVYSLLVGVMLGSQLFAQLPDFKKSENDPNANYFTIVEQWRSHFSEKQRAFQAANPSAKQLPEKLREEIAQFERWAYEWRDRVNNNGSFPNKASGWFNAMQTNPEMFTSTHNNRTTAVTWTSLGPTTNGIAPNWQSGGGVGRVNVVKRDPNSKSVLLAGTSSGGLFKSTDLGNNWTPMTDQFAGLGVSDVAFAPGNSNTIFLATGDFDKGSGGMNSIGLFKSTDGGATWSPKISFTLADRKKIAHIYFDPVTPNKIWVTATSAIYLSEDNGETWNVKYAGGYVNEDFNDFIYIGGKYYATSRVGLLYKSDNGNNWAPLYTPTNLGNRLDFTHSPAAPNILFLLAESNPGYSRYDITGTTAPTFSMVTNSETSDNEANFNTQQGYNQVIAVNPANANQVIIGEFSAKKSEDGGANWTNYLNGYWSTGEWGGFYVHSDHHFIEYISSDSVLIGNDGGVYIGRVNPASYAEKFNGLACTESYSISIFDQDPVNMIIGNQDNDGRSGVGTYTSPTSKPTWYGAQAGDGISTAIHRSNKNKRYLNSQNGKLRYTEDGYTGNHVGTPVTIPNESVFHAPLEMHLTDGEIIYGGFADVYKRVGNGAFATLNAGFGTWTPPGGNQVVAVKPKFLGLSNHPTDATKQRLIVIGENNAIRKATNENNWQPVSPFAGTIYNSIYWSNRGTSDTMIATATQYNDGMKVFFSSNGGDTWSNISGNLPNILMQKVIRKEGSDTVLLATELGVYFARLSSGGTILNNTWTKFGNGLPNVKVNDMEISYSKQQLYVATYGRGVWTASLNEPAPLPNQSLNFNYVKQTTGNSFKWQILDENVVKTYLEKSTDGSSFKTIASFSGADKTTQTGFVVAKESATTYYRLYYTKPGGQKVYSQIIVIRANGASFMVNVYPNPTKGNVFVSSQNTIAQVRILTLAGQQVSYARPLNNSYTFDMSLLPIGNYILAVTDDKGNNFQQKVVRN